MELFQKYLGTYYLEAAPCKTDLFCSMKNLWLAVQIVVNNDSCY